MHAGALPERLAVRPSGCNVAALAVGRQHEVSLGNRPLGGREGHIHYTRDRRCFGGHDNVGRCSAEVEATRGAASLRSLLSNGARVTQAAKAAWSGLVVTGDTVVDATCGNGHDTLELARLVGPSGCVIALDIQADAIESTRMQLQQELPAHLTPQVHLLNICHSCMQVAVHELGARPPALVCFNLGWLPSGGNKDVITRPGTTLEALRQAHTLVSDGGSISVIAYTGHQGGMAEYEGVRDLLAEFDFFCWVSTESRLLNREGAPRLLLAHRLHGRTASQRTSQAACTQTEV